jgi:hypothetical protein
MIQVFFIVKGPLGRFGGTNAGGFEASGRILNIDLFFRLFSPGD